MLIASWNINSIRVRLGILKEWIEKRRPDVVLLQEIKCENKFFPEEFLKNLGYTSNIHGEKGINGVAILINENISQELENVQIIDLNQTNQSRFIHIVLKKINICCLYTPNGNPLSNQKKFEEKLIWLKNLIKFAEPFLREEKDLILGGDFNVLENEFDVKDIDNWRNDALGHNEVIKYFRELIALGLTNVVRLFKKPGDCYSFWDYQKQCWQRNYGLLIDHFLVSPKIIEKISEFGIDSYTRNLNKPSDHVPIWIKID